MCQLVPIFLELRTLLTIKAASSINRKSNLLVGGCHRTLSLMADIERMHSTKSLGENSESINIEVNDMSSSLKRHVEEPGHDNHPCKFLKTSDHFQQHRNKKKFALYLMFSGKGYTGMLRNPGFKTIEGTLLEGLLQSDMIKKDETQELGQKLHFNRASRTDKGVSAAGQVVSLKMRSFPNWLTTLNGALPPEIRVLGAERVTRGFDSQKMCDSRTYLYLLPSYAFAPLEDISTKSYRISDDVVASINTVLQRFCGTKNFFNYTSGKAFEDRSAVRYMLELSCGSPFCNGESEFLIIKVKGQSFMIHQIRKMIGMTIALVRGMADHAFFEKTWLSEKMDVPKAPGLGLMLDCCHYDSYNHKFSIDGLHKSVTFTQFQAEIDKFKQEVIFREIIDTEETENSMLHWLETLHFHSFANSGIKSLIRTAALRIKRSQGSPGPDEGTSKINEDEDLSAFDKKDFNLHQAT